MSGVRDSERSVERRRVVVPDGWLDVTIARAAREDAPVLCAAHPADAFGAPAAPLVGEAAGACAVTIAPRGLGDSSPVAPGGAYTIDDMADDAAGLADALGFARADFVGASMGGMIVQTVAYRHPARVRSLVSIMSSTGAPNLPPAKPEAMAVLMRAPAPDRASALDAAVQTWRTIGSPGFPFDEADVRRGVKMFQQMNAPVITVMPQ